MKSLWRKIVMVGGLCLGLAAMGAADAGWQCKVHNARGQVWFGTAVTRAAASSYAMRFCVRGSTYARNCSLDYCQATGGAPAPAGMWQCNVNNARGQAWYGTGPTRASAAANAMGFCSAHSAYARNCAVQGCFVR